MVEQGDAIGALLIGSVCVVVFWRIFKAWRVTKIRKKVDEAKRDHENDVPHDADGIACIAWMLIAMLYQ